VQLVEKTRFLPAKFFFPGQFFVEKKRFFHLVAKNLPTLPLGLYFAGNTWRFARHISESAESALQVD